MDPLISITDLSKTYRVYEKPWHRLRELLTGRPCHQAFAALDGVSFELRRGESLGIVGQNGAGKSTLLKLLSGVTAPSRGEVHVRGKVASLLELGMGFHPEFTGRQNIRLNAAMMGLSEAEAERKVPEIVAFSELGDFIDRPVKTYSTGMTMRLGFAVAIQVEPDVLIIDEALSVGDGYFQKKCMDTILRFVQSGRTLVFCSHAMYYVSAYCQRAVWLRQGTVAAHGPVEQVVREYENFLLDKGEGAPPRAPADSDAAGPARITAVHQPQSAHRTAVYRHRQPFSLEIEWRTEDPALPFHVGVGIDRIDGLQVCSFGTHRDELPPFSGAGRYRTRLEVPELPMLQGEFSIYVFLLDEQGLHVYDQQILPSAFSVEPREREYQFGLVQVEHRWDRRAPASPEPEDVEGKLAPSP